MSQLGHRDDWLTPNYSGMQASVPSATLGLPWRPPHDRLNRHPRPALARRARAAACQRRGAASITFPSSPPRRAARRSPISTGTRSSTSPAASAASTSATRIRTSSLRRRSNSSGSRTPISRSFPTRSTRSCPSASSRSRPFSGPAKAAFFNAGTEAVENAVKFARAYTGRPAVIGFEGGFHGRTMLSLSLTSKTHPYKAGLGPFAPEVYRVPFPNAYRGPSAAEALEALTRAFVDRRRERDGGGDRGRASTGRGGFIPAAPSSCAACARSATSTASSWSATRCRPDSRAPAASSRSSTSASSPT